MYFLAHAFNILFQKKGQVWSIRTSYCLRVLCEFPDISSHVGNHKAMRNTLATEVTVCIHNSTNSRSQELLCTHQPFRRRNGRRTKGTFVCGGKNNLKGLSCLQWLASCPETQYDFMHIGSLTSEIDIAFIKSGRVSLRDISNHKHWQPQSHTLTKRFSCAVELGCSITTLVYRYVTVTHCWGVSTINGWFAWYGFVSSFSTCSPYCTRLEKGICGICWQFNHRVASISGHRNIALSANMRLTSMQSCIKNGYGIYLHPTCPCLLLL